MGKFIELRFGQGDLGKKLINGQESHEFYVQRELIPISALKDAYIILPEKRNIRITYENKGRLFSRTEYYRNEIDCIKRWCMIRKACGIAARDLMKYPVALPDDVEELPEWYEKKEDKNE